jgi:hypothetical protein
MVLTNMALSSIQGMAAEAARGGIAAEAARGGMAAEAARVTVGVTIQIGVATIAIGGILLPEITGSPGDLALARNHHRRAGVGGDEGVLLKFNWAATPGFSSC